MLQVKTCCTAYNSQLDLIHLERSGSHIVSVGTGGATDNMMNASGLGRSRLASDAGWMLLCGSSAHGSAMWRLSTRSAGVRSADDSIEDTGGVTGTVAFGCLERGAGHGMTWHDAS